MTPCIILLFDTIRDYLVHAIDLFIAAHFIYWCPVIIMVAKVRHAREKNKKSCIPIELFLYMAIAIFMISNFMKIICDVPVYCCYILYRVFNFHLHWKILCWWNLAFRPVTVFWEQLISNLDFFYEGQFQFWWLSFLIYGPWFSPK